jgi:1-acyl-sn-glycerol-3-phosphate acyltransferase
MSGTGAFQRAGEYLRLHLGYALLGLGCLAWTVIAIPLNFLLPARRRAPLGRRVAMLGFRAYLRALELLGVARFDLSALDALRGGRAVLLAPNHPGLLDALLVISRLPNVACVQKASLLGNPLWGAGSRLAGYIRNDWFVGSVRLAVGELRAGNPLLLFPEGTRTGRRPVGDFQSAAAYIAGRAGVPIQSVIIEEESGFLGKHWPLLRAPGMPMHFRVRLGRCFDAPRDAAACTAEMHAYFVEQLARGRAAAAP